MSEKLKPCPHCGGTARVDMDKHGEKVTVWTVRCRSCGASGPYLERLSEKMAIKAWNRRVEPEAEKLTKICKDISNRLLNMPLSSKAVEAIRLDILKKLEEAEATKDDMT